MKKECTNEKKIAFSAIFLALLFILFSPGLLMAQTAKPVLIKGTVYDGATPQSTVPGASVRLKGSTKSTITDDNGKFQIEVPSPQSVLVISYIGLESKEVTPGGRQI
jgi:hypothetical protein